MINPLSQQPRRAGWRNATGWAIVLSVAAHLLVALAMLTARAPLEPLAEDPPILVTLYDPPRPPPPPPPPPEPQPAPAAPAPADPAPAAPSPPARPAPKIKVHVPRTVVAPIPPVHVTAAPVSQPFATLSDGQLVGAITAGSGGGGGGEGAGGGSGAARCDMVERLQAALRRDADIQAVVAGARRGTGGRALHVWNGDWVQNPGQAGKGLAGLRQAIAMEVAFAPAACRAQPMRGLVLITLGDGARLALGSGTWRWTDLLAARR